MQPFGKVTDLGLESDICLQYRCGIFCMISEENIGEVVMCAWVFVCHAPSHVFVGNMNKLIVKNMSFNKKHIPCFVC